MNLRAKTALITGASGGIGASIARCFLNAGASLILGYRSNKKPVMALAEELMPKLADGAGLHTSSFDAAEETQVLDAFTGFAKQHFFPDIIINNAGAFPNADLLQISATQWDQVQADNLRSCFLVSREAVKGWQKTQTAGVIVNIASIAASMAQEDIDHYCAAKAGMVSLTVNMARKFGEYGIRVNALSPGLVFRNSLNEDWPEGVKRWNRAAPLGRVILPAEVASTALFLASDASSGITGVNLAVDAGMGASLPF